MQSAAISAMGLKTTAVLRPSSGLASLTIPFDSAEELSLHESEFGAQYGAHGRLKMRTDASPSIIRRATDACAWKGETAMFQSKRFFIRRSKSNIDSVTDMQDKQAVQGNRGRAPQIRSNKTKEGHRRRSGGGVGTTELQSLHQVAVDVTAQPDLVWSLWVDLKNAPKWMRWIQRVDILGDSTPPDDPTTSSLSQEAIAATHGDRLHQETATEHAVPSTLSSGSFTSPAAQKMNSALEKDESAPGRAEDDKAQVKGTTGPQNDKSSSGRAADSKTRRWTRATGTAQEETTDGRSTTSEVQVPATEKLRHHPASVEPLQEKTIEGSGSQLPSGVGKPGKGSAPEHDKRGAGQGVPGVSSQQDVPRVNSLSRWVCSTTGFEVAWVAQIESVELDHSERVLRWRTVEGLQCQGEVRFTATANGSATHVELTASYNLPQALTKVMNKHALNSLVEATLKSDLESFQKHVLHVLASQQATKA